MSEQTKKILIVDDQESWCDTMSDILEEIGCTVDFAKTYPEAQAKLKNGKYDLSIIDIRLQEEVDYNVAGIDLLEWIQKNRQGQPSAIILTGHATAALKQKTEWYGAYAFIEKSYERTDFGFDREIFLKTVRKALQ